MAAGNLDGDWRRWLDRASRSLSPFGVFALTRTRPSRAPLASADCTTGWRLVTSPPSKAPATTRLRHSRKRWHPVVEEALRIRRADRAGSDVARGLTALVREFLRVRGSGACSLCQAAPARRRDVLALAAWSSPMPTASLRATFGRPHRPGRRVRFSLPRPSSRVGTGAWRPVPPALPGRALRLALYALAGCLLVLLILVLILAAAERLAYRERVLPGVRLSGVQVAGQRLDKARAGIAATPGRLERDPVVGQAAGLRLGLDPGTVGVEADAAATADAVARAGRHGNPFAQSPAPWSAASIR